MSIKEIFKTNQTNGLYMDEITSHYVKKVDKLKQEKKFEEALKLSEKVNKIQKEQRSSDYWYKRGIRFSELGEYEKSLDCYNKDLEVHEKSFETFFEKGKILLRLKKYPDALESLNKASEVRNQQFLKSSKKVKHLKKARKFEKALTYTDKAINEKPLDEMFWYYKGIVLQKLKKYSEASLCFNNAVTIKSDSKFLYELAKCHLFLKNKERSIDLLNEAKLADPSIKEKLRVDNDFSSLENDKKFRIIIGL